MNKYTQCNYFIQNRTEKATNCNLIFSINKPTDDIKNAAPKKVKVSLGQEKKVVSISTQCNNILKPEFKGKINKQIQTDLKVTRASRVDFGCQTDFEYCIRNKKLSHPDIQKFPKEILQTLNKPQYDAISFEIKKLLRGEYAISFVPALLGLIEEDIEPVSLLLTESGKCTFAVVFRPVETFNLICEGTFDQQKFEEFLTLMINPKYVYCPGIPEEKVKGVCNPKLNILSQPFPRYQSKDCQVFYFSESRRPNLDRILRCNNCLKLMKCLGYAQKRKAELTPVSKIKRARISSNYKTSYMTPTTKAIRQSKLASARNTLLQKNKKLQVLFEERNLTLNEHHSNEMSKILQILNQNFPNEVESAIISVGGNTDIQDAIRKNWQKDSAAQQNKDYRNFLTDQLKFNTGRKQNSWSSISYRIALSIYTRSPAAYEALKSFNILQLPSVSSLKNKTRHLNSKPGIDHNYLKEESLKYASFQEEKRRKGEKVPLGEGVLIFDEVKVIDKIIWNSKNHQFIGLAMTEDEFVNLHDIFEGTTGKPATPAQYILQFLWRDMSSEYDVIGPYFSSSSSVKHSFVLACLYETIRVFQAYQFLTLGIVCDGASENLTLIKLTLQHKGAFRWKKNGNEYDFSVDPSFKNPFCPGRLIHWVICPTHELKSLIAALYSSRHGGPKDYKLCGYHFGWKQVLDLGDREEERKKKGLLRFEPNLEQSYLIRDAWTRLNVVPSKIFQQENILSELFGFYNSSDGTEVERMRTLQCYRYLRACNKIFENGLLCKDKITSMESDIIKSLKDGYQYFESWANDLVTDDPEIELSKPTQKVFLSWQTWDLLRITVFGFLNLCRDFLSRYPAYFISPSRVNGSAVESLFSQFKYATGSKLSSVNYSTARKSVLVRRNIHGHHKNNRDYRNVSLHLREANI